MYFYVCVHGYGCRDQSQPQVSLLRMLSLFFKTVSLAGLVLTILCYEGYFRCSEHGWAISVPQEVVNNADKGK